MDKILSLPKGYKVIGIHRNERLSGVYVFMNLLKKKVYVGQTSDNAERFEQHLKAMFINSNEGNGTNKKLKNDCETIEVEFFNVKNKEYLYDYETALMYVCRENGFKLYNGGDDDNDDVGRKELISGDERVDWEYCKKNYIYNKDLACSNYQEIKNKFEKWFADTYNIKIIDGKFDKKDEELKEIWKKRVDLFKSSEDYFWVSSTGKINGSDILTISDMEDCEIDGIEINELLDKYDTTYAMWSTFGLYIGQGPITILKTKMHDIKNLELVRHTQDRNFTIESKKNHNGICVWSLKKWGIDFKRNKLACQKNGEDKFRDKRLLFLPYTSSNKTVDLNAVSLNLEIRDDESLGDYLDRLQNTQNAKDFYASGYKISDKDKINDFPKDMFPELINKAQNNMAFLISKFYYLKDVDLNNLQCIKSSDSIQAIYQDADSKNINDSFKQEPCKLIKIDREKLANTIKEKKTDGKVVMLVAVLEYPYIINIV